MGHYLLVLYELRFYGLLSLLATKCHEFGDFNNFDNGCPLCTCAWCPKVAMLSDILAAFLIDLVFDSSKPYTPDGWFGTSSDINKLCKKGTISTESAPDSCWFLSSWPRVRAQSFKVAHDCNSITGQKKL